MATGFPVKANYATGDVLTAANMNDLSGTVNYLQYMPPRNPVLNSNFSVWQRGTSFSLAASTAYTSGYVADRWDTTTGANQACTISRQSTSDTTNLPNIQYCARYQRNSGQTGTGELYLTQSFESVNSIPFAGKTVTLSFYARAGANYSATSSALKSYIGTGTGTDQNVFLPFTGFASNSQTNTLTTTWQRFTQTYAVPATVTQLAVYFGFTPTGTASTNDYYEVTGVQLELGSAANTYMPNQPTYQGELAACQRYYYRTTASGAYAPFSTAIGASSTTVCDSIVVLPVQMRTAPSTTFETSNIALSDQTTAYSSGTWSMNSNVLNPNLVQVRYTHGSAALTQYRPYIITANNSTSAYIGFSAEL